MISNFNGIIYYIMLI